MVAMVPYKRSKSVGGGGGGERGEGEGRGEGERRRGRERERRGGKETYFSHTVTMNSEPEMKF